MYIIYFSLYPLLLNKHPLTLYFNDILSLIRVAFMNMGAELYLVENGQLTGRVITEK